MQCCERCGREFKAYVSQKRRFCSRTCQAEAQKVAKTAFKMRKGYRTAYVGRDHPMADGEGNCYEHRLVMAEHLGRILGRHEHVHHLNGDKLDNQPENLVLVTPSAHMALHRRADGWSHEHCACVECGTTAVAHAGHGLCRRCYMRQWHAGQR